MKTEFELSETFRNFIPDNSQDESNFILLGKFISREVLTEKIIKNEDLL